jgi:hypothetical protein
MSAFAIVMALSVVLGGASLEAGEGSTSLTVAGDADRVWIHADHAPLGSVLGELARVAGIRVVVVEPGAPRLAAEVVSARLDGVPVDEAARRLLRGKNLILVYGRHRLTEIHLRGGRAPVAAAAPPEPGSPRPPSGAAPDDAGIDDEPGRLDRLRERVLDHPDAGARVAALEALGGARDTARVVTTVAEVLARDRHPAVLEAALDLLAAMPDPPLEAIGAFARGAAGAALRVQALGLLGERLGTDARARAAVRRLARTDAVADVRNAARMLLETAPR